MSSTTAGEASSSSSVSHAAASLTSPAPVTSQQLEQLLASHTELLTSLTPRSLTCLRNLAQFTAAPPATPFPTRKLAGVLVLLHVQPDGELGVTLTTRSKRMRSHPGETALPGGRAEESDESIEACALREANEEVGLPLSSTTAPLLHLTTLPAFTSRTLLVVVPSVFLLVASPDEAARVLQGLEKNKDEVDAIFEVPLRALLGLESSEGTRPTRSASTALTLTHTYEDLIWLRSTLYRLHSFSHPSLPSPITGLTADILLTTALVGYYGLDEEEEAGRMEERKEGRLGFERWAEGQMGWKEIVQEALGMEGMRGLERGRKEL